MGQEDDLRSGSANDDGVVYEYYPDSRGHHTEDISGKKSSEQLRVEREKLEEAQKEAHAREQAHHRTSILRTIGSIRPESANEEAIRGILRGLNTRDLPNPEVIASIVDAVRSEQSVLGFDVVLKELMEEERATDELIDQILKDLGPIARTANASVINIHLNRLQFVVPFKMPEIQQIIALLRVRDFDGIKEIIIDHGPKLKTTALVAPKRESSSIGLPKEKPGKGRKN